MKQTCYWSYINILRKQLTQKTNRSTDKSKRKFKKYPEKNDKESTVTHNLWDAAKAVLRRRLIVRAAARQHALTPQGVKQGPQCRVQSAALALGLQEVKEPLQLLLH